MTRRRMGFEDLRKQWPLDKCYDGRGDMMKIRIRSTISAREGRGR